jgi:3',5'-cyclic AMP phosphodiesterase CpdA
VLLRPLVLSSLLASSVSSAALAQPPPPAPPPEVVRAILPPRNPLPPEPASAAATRFSFIAYGDTRGRREGKDEQYEHNLVVETMLSTVKRLETTPFPVRFVLMTGDAVMSGRDPRQWNTSFATVVNRLTQGAGLPYYLSPGNHDLGYVIGERTDRGAGLRNYLAAMAELIPKDGNLRRLDGYPTYAFGYGNVFLLALDSNIASDDRQLEWARRQLEGLDRARFRHVVAFFHHPVFSSGPHGGTRLEPSTAALRKRWMPLFRRHRVALVLTGHEHLFEHWVERYEESGRRYRLDEIVTGGGGAPIYTFQGRPDLREYLQAGQADKVAVTQLVRPGPDAGDNPYHYVVIQVDGDRLRTEVVGVDWGAGFAPYRSRGAALSDDAATEAGR